MSLFKKKEEKKVQEVKPKLLEGEGEKKARDTLKGLLDSEFKPFEGTRFADFQNKGELEQSLLDFINRGSKENKLETSAETALQGFLDAGANPEDSPLFKARRSALIRERDKARNRFLRSQQARGISKSSPTDAGLGELDAITANNIGLALGEEFDKIIGRQQGAIAPALAQARKRELEPIATAEQISRFGTILKAIEQEPLDFDFQQFQAENNFEFDRLTPIAQMLLQNPETFYFPQFVESPEDESNASGIGRLGGSILGGVLGAIGGGPGGAVAGANTGGTLGEGIGGLF